MKQLYMSVEGETIYDLVEEIGSAINENNDDGCQLVDIQYSGLENEELIPRAYLLFNEAKDGKKEMDSGCY